MKKSTMVELVEELRKLPQTQEIKFMIKEALEGEYHDYKNRKYMCGKMESSQRLHQLGHHELARRIESGEFDEEADQEDKENILDALKTVFSGDELKEAIKLFGLKP